MDNKRKEHDENQLMRENVAEDTEKCGPKMHSRKLH